MNRISRKILGWTLAMLFALAFITFTVVMVGVKGALLVYGGSIGIIGLVYLITYLIED